jgi:integrase
MQSEFKTPVLCKTNPKDWYILIRFFHSGKWHDIKRREGINREKDLKKRREEALALCEARLQWLNDGWNPVTDPKYLFKANRSKEREMSFVDALTFAFSKKVMKKKSIQDYRGMIEYFKTVAKKTGYSHLYVAKIDRGMLLDLLDECAKLRSFSNHAYNKYASCLRSLFSELVEYRILNFNPLLQFRKKDVPESNKYASYTEEEKIKISKHLSIVHPPLFVVMSVVYHTGIREKEVLELKINDIDLSVGIITIAQTGDGENSKTSNVRRVPINSHLNALLTALELEKFPGSFFVFGSPSIKGKGNGGSGSRIENGRQVWGAMRTDYFKPNKTAVDRDTLTRLWKKLIIDGLGIKKHLYAAKHTGTDDKVDAGLDLSDIQFMYGHKSEAMTMRYNKRKRELEAKKEILDKSPAFTIPNKLKAV